MFTLKNYLNTFSIFYDRKCEFITNSDNLYNKEQICLLVCLYVCPSMHSNCGHFRAEPITYSESV